jgi:hypothetical protein
MLTSGELDRVRAELGYNVLDVGAEPYIGVQAYFSQVLKPYLREGLETSTSTAVAENAAGSLVNLLLVDVTGLTLRSRIVVDVDDFLEAATVRAISGSTITVLLKKAHVGTYPISVDAGLQIVRECLAALFRVQQLIDELEGEGAIKKVDEVEFYDASGRTRLQLLEDQQRHWRRRLSSAIGFPLNPSASGFGGGSVAMC